MKKYRYYVIGDYKFEDHLTDGLSENGVADYACGICTDSTTRVWLFCDAADAPLVITQWEDDETCDSGISFEYLQAFKERHPINDSKRIWSVTQGQLGDYRYCTETLWYWTSKDYGNIWFVESDAPAESDRVNELENPEEEVYEWVRQNMPLEECAKEPLLRDVYERLKEER